MGQTWTNYGPTKSTETSPGMIQVEIQIPDFWGEIIHAISLCQPNPGTFHNHPLAKKSPNILHVPQVSGWKKIEPSTHQTSIRCASRRKPGGKIAPNRSLPYY